jgi:hypothetical protein
MPAMFENPLALIDWNGGARFPASSIGRASESVENRRKEAMVCLIVTVGSNQSSLKML